MESAIQLQGNVIATTTGVDRVIVVYVQGIGKELIVHWLL
jgi:hypothetical protein